MRVNETIAVDAIELSEIEIGTEMMIVRIDKDMLQHQYLSHHQ